MADAIQETSNVGVAKGRPGGYGVVAPAGTDPSIFEDMKKTLADIIDENPDVKSLGFISEDGLEWGTDTNSSEVKDWGGNVISRSLTSFAETVKVMFLETRESVLRTVFGDGNVTVDGPVTTVLHNADFTAPHLYAFDSIVSETKVKRSILPIGSIFERDSRTENSSDVAGYTPTISALPYPGFKGSVCKELIYDTASEQVVTVTGVAVKSADGSAAPATLAANATAQLKAEATWSDGSVTDVTADAQWESSDASKATVSASGLATWKAQGTAKVTATYQGVKSPEVSIACAAPATK